MDDVESARMRFFDLRQLRLFPLTPRDLCQKTGLNWLAALRLHEQGFLSFNPATEKDLNEAQAAEFLFLGSLVVAGCDEEMLMQLLRGLQKPYQYQIGIIYYDWATQRWRILPKPEESDRDELLYGWLDELAQQGDVEALQEIEQSVQAAIKTAKEVIDDN